jgi:PhnB protein
MPEPRTSQALTPYLCVSDANAAIEFYKKALGATEIRRSAAPGTDKLMHAHLRILDSDLMLADDFPEFMGGKSNTPQAIGSSPVTLHLQVPNADELWEKALAAGATVVMPLADQFWGDRYGQFKDPFGHSWSVGQAKYTPTEEEIEAGAKASLHG